MSRHGGNGKRVASKANGNNLVSRVSLPSVWRWRNRYLIGSCPKVVGRVLLSS